MCLPADVIPSLQCAGKARDIIGSRWAVDQRPFIWAAASGSSGKPQGPLWTSWNDTVHYPGAPLPYASIQVNAGESDERIEADSSSRFGCSLRASATSPVPGDLETQQSKVWEPRPKGREAGLALRSFFGSPHSGATSGVDTLQLSREGSVVSCTSSPRISGPAVVQRKFRPTKVLTGAIEAWGSSRSKEEESRKSARVEGLVDEDRMQNGAAMKRKHRPGSTCNGKTSRIVDMKSARHTYNGPGVPKKDISRSKEMSMSMSESLSDNENLSDDEGAGSPAVTEKRRKRMLSNRASAQRSRQRRQERLDTLEVLVAELRVENASLTRRANTSSTAAKKFEDEVKILQDRLGKQESIPLSNSNGSNESEKTTETSHLAAVAIRTKTNGSSTDCTEGTRRHGNSCPREKSGPSKIDCDEDQVEDMKRWSDGIAGSNFDYVFNFDPTLGAAATHRGTPCRTAVPENSAGGVAVKDLYQPAILSPAQTPSFQTLDPFGIDEQYNQEMDKKNLLPRSEDDSWMEILANCLK